MIIVIRISGLVEVPSEVQETLWRMRLRRKYTAILLRPSEENMKLLRRIRNFVAYGPLNKEVLLRLIQQRGIFLDKKKILPAEEVIEQLEKKSLQVLNLKPFFRLHPPRGGIDSKLHFPLRKGVLGDHKEKINDLIMRML